MNAEEYSLRGDNYFSERNFDKAIEDYSETIKFEPDNPFAYYKRGLSYINKKEIELAIADLEMAVKIDPHNKDFRGTLEELLSSERKGCLGFFSRFYRRLSKAGKIGAVAGLASMVIASFVSNPLNVVFFAPMGLLFGAGIGTLIGILIRKSSRAGRLGGIIGAAITFIFFVTIGIITGQNNLVVALICSFIGGILGIFIGSIVGFILKRTSKR